MRRLTPDDKPALSRALSAICVLQAQYGKTPAELKTLVDGFYWALDEYTLEQILKALKEFVKQKPTIPTPSDIIGIIKTMSEKITEEELAKRRFFIQKVGAIA